MRGGVVLDIEAQIKGVWLYVWYNIETNIVKYVGYQYI